MIKLLLLVNCLLVAVNAGTYGGQKIGLEDIERDLHSNQKSNYRQPKASDAAVLSPTRFGYVPKRTAASYAATKPNPQYVQSNYKVKTPSYQAQSTQHQQQYTTTYTQPQTTYQQQYTLPAASDYSQLYTSGSQQNSFQQAQDYAYVQPDVQQQYAVQYQQPSQGYEQYENVQYVTDNSIAKTEGQYSQAPQPQYYFVQPQQSSTNAVESVIDPKAVQYLLSFPSYSPNSISIDQKQLEKYTTSVEPELPPVKTTITKYTKATPSKSSSTKHAGQKQVGHVVSSSPAKTQYHSNDQFLFKREPKSLLDSYVPSYVQLQYLRQQGRDGTGYTKF